MRLLPQPPSGNAIPTCRHCGTVEPPRLRWHVFGNGKRHIRAECVACGTFLRFAPQTRQAIAVADGNPHYSPAISPAPKPRKLPPLVVDTKRLARLLCCALRTIRVHDAEGKLPLSLKIGDRTLWSLTEIRDWLAAGAPDRAAWEARKAHPAT